jgi:hypothetical protein
VGGGAFVFKAMKNKKLTQRRKEAKTQRKKFFSSLRPLPLSAFA